MDDTIFALSSGAPPAAIGIIRISGSRAGEALAALAGTLPEPRRPGLRTLRDASGAILDTALLLWFPGPGTATGEDLAEIHCHGGRAVVAAILGVLGTLDALREAEPGEFTRRAFANGRIDLAEAEGLADLLSAETEWQRRGALTAAGGALSRRIEEWRTTVLELAARLEAAIDFSDEDDVETLPAGFRQEIAELGARIGRICDRPAADRLRDGIRVVFAGPPNTGKSSLFNALLEEGAAIVSAEAGTTRDVIERPVAIAGVPFVLVDTAGLRAEGAGEIESIGIGRAQEQIAKADIVLWLGDPADAPEAALRIHSKSDLARAPQAVEHSVSVVTGTGLDSLVGDLVRRGREALPPVDRPAFNRRQKVAAGEARDALYDAAKQDDLLVLAEDLRTARRCFDRLVGRESTEEMLDALFGRFCIGK